MTRAIAARAREKAVERFRVPLPVRARVQNVRRPVKADGLNSRRAVARATRRDQCLQHDRVRECVRMGVEGHALGVVANARQNRYKGASPSA